MNITDVIQAISAGICSYAGIVHLLANLRRAMGDRASQLVDLIAQIEADHPYLTKALRAMVDEYQFRQIVALTDVSTPTDEIGGENGHA